MFTRARRSVTATSTRARRRVARVVTLGVVGLGLALVPGSPAQAVDSSLCYPNVNAQWRFGVGAGLDFKAGLMQATGSSMNTAEGVATVSDQNGDLLFYTDGVTVWGPNDVALPGGSGLMGDASSTQSAVIVPRPGSTTQYYIFTNGTSVNRSTGKVNYSVVDTSLGTYGEVLAAGKNTSLHGPGGEVTDYPTEKLAASPHANGTDAWLATTGGTFGAGLEGANPYSIYIWSVTASGVSLHGSYDFPSPAHKLAYNGEVEFSADGSHIAAANRNGTALHLYDFNSASGVVSNKRVVTGSLTYGVEFSPDGELLYASENSAIRQYAVDTLPTTATSADATATFTPSATANGAKTIETGPDGRLYVAQASGGNHGVNNAMGVIHYPDTSGSGASYSTYTDIFPGGATKGSTSGLPNSVSCPVETVVVDWGDAPDSYGTTLLANGPRHGLPGQSATTADLMLGDAVGFEADGQPDSATHAALDTHDDGLVSFNRSTGVAQVKVSNDTASPATLAGWLDADTDNAFGAGERVVVPVPANTTATYDVDFDVTLASNIDTYLRFRVFTGTVAAPSALGAAAAGEVEDHFTTFVNTAPVISPETPTLTTDEDTDGTVDLTATDADSDPLTWSIGTQGTKGTATIAPAGTGNAKTITYTPDTGATGTDSFTVTVDDGNGGTDTVTVNVTITPAPVNTAPVISPEAPTLTTDEDTDGTVDLTATDADSDPLTWSIGTQGTKGTATVAPAGTGNAKTITYSPDTGATGTDSFTVTVDDGNGGTDTVTVNVNIEEDVEEPEGGISSWGNNSHGQVGSTPTDDDFVQLAAGIGHSIGLRQDGSMKAWGRNDFGQAAVQAGTDWVEVDAAGAGSIGLRADGTLTVWGRNVNNVITNAPTGNTFVDVALGNGHGSAVRADGTVVSWGTLDGGIVVAQNPTASDFVEVDAGQNFSVALTDDGSIVAWGADNEGQVSDAPTGDGFISISANDHGAIAVHDDGTLHAWGWDRDDQVTDTPVGDDFVDAAFGVWGGVAVRTDGTLVAWGLDNERQVTNTPDGDVYFAVAAGASHYLALGAGAVTEDPEPSGSPVVSWGNDSHGQVKTTPTSTDFVQVAGGIGHSIGLRKDGSIIAWGRNDFSQVTARPTGTDFVEVDAGGAGSMALRQDGSIEVWGRNVNNVVTDKPSGTGFIDVALGNGHGSAVKADGTVVSWGTLDGGIVVAQNPTASDFVEVDAGQNFSVALTDDGSIVAWGADNEGQVSDAPNGAGFVSVSANDHGAIAVHSDGSLHAWGWDRDKQVTNTPTGTNFLDAAFGVWGGVALRKDGTLVSWGLNNALQVSTTPKNGGYVDVAAGASHYLAIGSEAPAPTPEPAARLSSWGSNSHGQVVGTPTGTFKAFDGGIGHAIGLRPNGTIVTWGRNDHGQVSPAPGGSFVDVGAGGAGTIALRSNGSIAVWGRNVGGLVTNVPAGSFIDVAIGSGHGVALRTDGSIATWGQNTAGAVSAKPTGSNFVAVEAGQDFSLAITDDGSLRAWGSNAWGRVSNTPTGTGFVKVSISDHTAMALKSDGSFVTWGWDQYGQVSKAPKTGVYVDIAASVWGGAAVRADGSVVAWGLDNEKQVVNAPKGKGYFAIAAGSAFYMALGSTAVVSPDLVETKLTKKPDKVLDIKAKKTKVKFVFTADQPGARFECKIDSQRWKACTAPKKYKLGLGKHTFKVRAVVAGRTDSTPESYTFRIK